MPKKVSLAGLALVALLALPGCWVRIDSNPGNVDAAFRKALDEVERIQSVPSAQRGKPRRVRLLVYDEGDDQLVRLSVPLWLVRRIADHQAEDEREAGGRTEELARYGLTVDRILSGGRGVLLQADEDDAKVLVWLE